MKTTRKHTYAALLIGSVVASSSANAAVLLGGFDGINDRNSPLQDLSAVGNVTVTLSGANSNVPMQQLTALWGTATLTPGADAITDRTVLINDSGSAILTLVVTNTNSVDLALETLHWRVKRDGANAATDVTITYLSGDLADTDGVSGSQNLGAVGTRGFDYGLSTFLTDLTLAPTESATFTFATTGNNGQRTRFDNFAISGTIPEPSTALLGALGMLALLRRRR